MSTKYVIHLSGRKGKSFIKRNGEIITNVRSISINADVNGLPLIIIEQISRSMPLRDMMTHDDDTIDIAMEI